MIRNDAGSPQRFQGLSQPASLQLSQILLKEAVLGRLRWEDDKSGIPVQMAQNDGFMVCYQRNHLPAPLHWIDGKQVKSAALDPGQFLMLDLARSHSSINRGDVDCVSIFASRSSIVEFHLEHDLPRFATLRIADGVGYADSIIQNLMECLVPAFERPGFASQLFLGQLTLSLLARLTDIYGEHHASLRPLKGGLAPWQERRSKALLLSDLRGDVSLEALAGECGISRAHFARSFKATTGRSPMAWLLHQRLIRAKQLLADTTLTLSEIAHDCGFADQSHFSRVFMKHLGTPPREWRRQRKL
jgi:AraC-like DNA-binding protein